LVKRYYSVYDILGAQKKAITILIIQNRVMNTIEYANCYIL